VVGGLLGPALGAASLALYLVLGAAGLPVFAPAGLPGLARLFGRAPGHLITRAAEASTDGASVWLPRAQAVGKRVYEFTEYLVDQLSVTDLGARWEGTLTYHPSCHTLRGMQIDRQPRALLANVRGAQILDLPHAEECCGFGGIFSMEHPELSAEWLKRKIGNFETTQSPTLVVTECGCLMHIAGGLHRQKKNQRVMHIAEILNHF